MHMQPNPFLKAIRAGEPQIGLWVSAANGFTAEVVAGAGFDWVMLDMEHAPTNITTIHQQLQAFAPYHTTALTRPAWNDSVMVKQLMDTGTPGVLFPMVQSVEEAEAAVAACRYPPRGIRGVSGITRANNFGRMTDYFDRVEDETAILLQAETRKAIAQVEAFADVDGVDGIFFGPADIAADMGHHPNPMHPAVWDEIRPAAKRLMDKGMPVGTLVLDPAFARELIAEGFTFVACGTDMALLRAGTDGLLAEMKA